MHKCRFACAARTKEKKGCFWRLKKSVYYFHIATQNGIVDSFLPHLVFVVKYVNWYRFKDEKNIDPDRGMDCRKTQALQIANNIEKLILIIAR
jgi:hypothetical protein